MKITLDLVAGLPKKELVERIHYHRRQGDIAERALGFYLLDMDRRKMYRPLESASEWARKHLPEQQRPDKLILLARRLEKLPTIRAAFDSGEVPWTKIREIARIAKPEHERVWLDLARKLTCRELEAEVAGKKHGDPPGGGLKARRTKEEVRFSLAGEELATWEKGIRKVRKEQPGLTVSQAAAVLARNTYLTDPEGKIPGRKRHGREVDLLVLHRGRDGDWADTERGRVPVDPRIVEEKIRLSSTIRLTHSGYDT